MTTLLMDLKRGSLKDVRARRKFAKLLGLHATASWARLLHEVRSRMAARQPSPGSGDPDVTRAATDLDSLLADLMAMQPICKGLREGDAVHKVALAEPLEALR